MPLGKLQKDMHLGEGLPIAAEYELGSAVWGTNTRSNVMKRIDWRNISGICTTYLALTLTQISTTPAQAADYDIGSIHISQPWARATPKGASSGAAYMTITNNRKTADRVSCASSDASAQCQIHTMTMENGVMKMRPVKGGLEIKPGETVMLKPSSFHIMLMNLKQPLQQGKMVKATLKFENAGTINVEYPIAAVGAAAPGAPASGGSMMMEGHGGMMKMDKH
jgi:copper(I)-binding protein